MYKLKTISSIILLTILCLTSYLCKAQYGLGGNPNGQDWKILTTDAVRVIYPKGMEAKAQRIANIINYMDQNNRRSVGEYRRRIDLVLQNQTVNANGYVGLSPYRSEFYATPPATNLLLGSLDWLDILAIHEYRHAMQYVNGKRGIVKLAYTLQGEFGWALLNNLAIPNWYYEGDAAITETALTNAGRGRSSFFTLEQRALALANKNPSYQTVRNESYILNTPDRYRFGYMMLSKIRNDIGNDTIANVLKQASRFKGILYPFSKALKRNTGFNSTQLYTASWLDLKKKFKEQLESTNLISNTPLTEEFPKVNTSYRYPIVSEDDGIYVRKLSFDETEKMVYIKDKKETKLFTIGYNNDRWQHYANGKIVWTEIAVNSRRENEVFSNIMLYDLTKKKKSKLTTKSKYFSPIVSPNGQYIASIHISPSQENEIHILDINSGKIINKITTPKNYFLSRLAFLEDGNHLVTIAKNNSQLALIKIDINDKSIVELTPWSSHTMDAPSIKSDKVYFNASFSGIDNIYSTDLQGSKNIEQISSVSIGAFSPSISNKSNVLIYACYNYKGYYLAKQEIPLSRKNNYITITEPVDMKIFDQVANSAEGGNILNKVDSIKYDSKPYKALFKGMKLHTWSISPSLQTPTLNVRATNLLSDVQFVGGVQVNRNEKNALSFVAYANIARFYPDIHIISGQSKRFTDYYSSISDTISSQSFNETSLGVLVSLPHHWLKGNYSINLVPSTTLTGRKLSKINNESGNLPNINFSELESQLIFSAIRRHAYQNLAPRLGIEVIGIYTKSLGKTDANKISFSSKYYLPGLSKNHSLKLGVAFQNERLTNLYQFQDVFEYPRGYKTPTNDNYKLARIDYTFPVAYPDFGLFGITYFKRIAINLFSDYGIGNNIIKNSTNTYHSAGYEVYFDNGVLNAVNLRFGIRQAYRITDPLNNGRISRVEFFTNTLF